MLDLMLELLKPISDIRTNADLGTNKYWFMLAAFTVTGLIIAGLALITRRNEYYIQSKKEE